MRATKQDEKFVHPNDLSNSFQHPKDKAMDRHAFLKNRADCKGTFIRHPRLMAVSAQMPVPPWVRLGYPKPEEEPARLSQECKVEGEITGGLIQQSDRPMHVMTDLIANMRMIMDDPHNNLERLIVRMSDDDR